jgi:hypothetical protein
MNHHRQTKLFRRLPCDVERITPEYWEACRPHSNLDAHDCIAIGGYDLDRFGGRHQPEVAAFTDHNATGEPIDAGERTLRKARTRTGDAGRMTCSRNPT